MGQFQSTRWQSVLRVPRAAQGDLPHPRMFAQPGASHVAAIESIPDQVRVGARQETLLRAYQ